MLSVALSIAFLLGGNLILRATTESMFIHAFGSGRLPYAMTAVPFMMAALIYGYSRLLSKTGGMKSLLYSLGFSLAVFLLEYCFIKTGDKPAIAILYVFRESYGVIIMEQYWSFIDSILTHSEAKTFNGPIIGIGSLSSVFAGYLLSGSVKFVATEQFILISSATLVFAGILSWLAYKLTGEPRPSGGERQGYKGHLHLSLLVENRTVRIIAVFVTLAQVLSTMLSLRMYQLLEISFPNQDAMTAYMGRLFSAMNMFSFMMQFFATPLLLRFIPLRHVFVGIPAVHITTSLLLLFNPVLPFAMGAFIIFKGLDYSVFRASKEILYISLTFDARYRAKQVVDAFAYRLAKGLTAGALSVAESFMRTIPGYVYPSIGMMVSLLWGGCALSLASYYKETE